MVGVEEAEPPNQNARPKGPTMADLDAKQPTLYGAERPLQGSTRWAVSFTL